ncbi:MAG: glycosyltransferase family 2 protein [Elusimicrobia bacterium]|nr:glycosyltransferase family 2 protein [Elusimicrobiota bacterium]
MTPFFTVVIPTYNRSRMAAAAALSVLDQIEGDFQCLVVDDGSTDDTPRVLAALPKDERLHVIRMYKNLGQHSCRNLAIRLSHARFVTFLDSDDVYLPGRLAAFKDAARRRPEAGFWFSNAYVHRYGRVVGRLFHPDRAIPQGRVPGCYAVGDRWLPYVTTNVAIRRDAFDRFGAFREDLRILEDTELYARMLAGGLEVGSIAEPLAVRVLHASQITRDHERDFREALIALQSSGAQGEVLARLREALVLEVATYLWKELEPERAREFLRAELGEAGPWAFGPGRGLYWKTFLPAKALAAAKALRRSYLRARFAPGLAPGEFTAACRALESLRGRAACL